MCYSLGKYFAPAPRPLKTKRSDFTSFCNNRNDCGGVIWSNSATSERDSSAYYLVKRKGLLASSCFQHSFFYTCYIFDFLYFMTRILSHLWFANHWFLMPLTPSSAIRIPNCNCSIFSISSYILHFPRTFKRASYKAILFHTRHTLRQFRLRVVFPHAEKGGALSPPVWHTAGTASRSGRIYQFLQQPTPA